MNLYIFYQIEHDLKLDIRLICHIYDNGGIFLFSKKICREWKLSDFGSNTWLFLLWKYLISNKIIEDETTMLVPCEGITIKSTTCK